MSNPNQYKYPSVMAPFKIGDMVYNTNNRTIQGPVIDIIVWQDRAQGDQTPGASGVDIKIQETGHSTYRAPMEHWALVQDEPLPDGYGTF